jgi:hypothetical protein
MLKYVVLALLTVLLAASVAGATMELRTWATTAAAPADGGSHSASASFDMVSRLGGPFVGSASSASFALWGCSVTPVEGSFFATETEPLRVTLRWTVASPEALDGFNVYRGWQGDGVYDRINADMLPPESPGVYEDTTVWPGSEFTYDVRAVWPDGSEESIAEPFTVRTGGRLSTRLYSAAPNPFSATTSIQFDIASAGDGATIAVYDISGRVVKTFDEPIGRPGRYTVVWDGRNDRGREVASGVYFLALEIGGERDTGRLVYLR